MIERGASSKEASVIFTSALRCVECMEGGRWRGMNGGGNNDKEMERGEGKGCAGWEKKEREDGCDDGRVMRA